MGPYYYFLLAVGIHGYKSYTENIVHIFDCLINNSGKNCAPGRTKDKGRIETCLLMNWLIRGHQYMAIIFLNDLNEQTDKAKKGKSNERVYACTEGQSYL